MVGFPENLLAEIAALREHNARLETLLGEGRLKAQALLESEERYRSLITVTSAIVWTAGSDGAIIEEVPSWEEFTGQSPEQYQGWGWVEMLHPEDRASTAEIWRQANADKRPVEAEYRLRRRDGEYRHMVARGVPLLNAQGRLCSWVGTVTDIHDRKVAEQQRELRLLQAKRHTTRLQKLAEASLAINSALSIQQVLQGITEQAAALIGAHMALTSLTPERDWARAVHTVYLSDKYGFWHRSEARLGGVGIAADVCRTNRPLRLTQSQLEAHPQGRLLAFGAADRPALRGWLAAPLVGRDGRNIGLIQLSDKHEGDFSEEDEAIAVQLAQLASVAIENTRLFEAEQAAKVDAEEANRLKDEFLATLSHELRSPLTAILGWTRLLRQTDLGAVRAAHALEVIERNALAQNQLIEDLLDISRIVAGKLRIEAAAVDLAGVIEAAIGTVRPAAQARAIEVDTEIEPGVPPLMGDATRLQQVVWNLLANAVKFTPNGGRVRVRLARRGTAAEVAVSDSGQGIAPHLLPHVFERFRQADSSSTRSHGGLGLGLAIVRQLVELHGGTVSAASPGEGQGATFTVRLPFDEARALLAGDHSPGDWTRESPTACCGRLDGLRVLVVDDEPQARELVRTTLELCGAQVATAGSAAEALAEVRRFKPAVLVSDIAMPGEDGYALLRQMRLLEAEHGWRIPAVALTAYARVEDRRRALLAGFQTHLSKPVEPSELVAAVANLSCRSTL
ncbi:ATP-binding protein [Gloeobacter morelensis]|uniref:histidine kinase n=1 Tax=Gloeobacter morelensis MG652769 TaxID=2781736 RepID=A0ABY3PPS8_9CYAN|nr:ATP-binding protein [Gloeobacter morelensis]UFP95640.1 response regulator [Gloeobacter morelensis MG652769]